MSQNITFTQTLNSYSWNEVTAQIYAKTARDVEAALGKERRSLNDFMALISPAAAPYLEQMAVMSQQLTRKRFGKTVALYNPLYLSNVCSNSCTYCGFGVQNKIPRKVLTPDEILQEAMALKNQGFDNVLLVTGEAEKLVGAEYLRDAVRLLRSHFSYISLEVQPLEEHEYAMLEREGVYAVLVYQETYNRANYPNYHVHGKKSDFDYRLQTPDRLGRAGMHKIGLGILLGLEEWRTDCFFTAVHQQYLEKRFWQTKYSISFPRLRPNAGGFEPNVVVKERDLAQLICAWRLFNEEIELSISTRENQKFRDNCINFGITSMSAGARTNPGGYAVASQSLPQFEVGDHRDAALIVDMVKSRGLEPVWKDWDKSLVLN